MIKKIKNDLKKGGYISKAPGYVYYLFYNGYFGFTVLCVTPL